MIRVIAVGSIKEAALKEGIKEYLKRLSAFTPIEIVEIKEVTNKTINQNIENEGLAILSKIASNDFVITLEIEGKMLTSEELSEKISSLLTYGNSRIAFVIGGSNGLSDKVKLRSNLALSLSRLTFPHQWVRLMLMEQLYRVYTIFNNHDYHK
ncbi:MAG: 23S rRNA (pseudouridine(1915)-N(3))-methyltransferase RlmH [Bacilli bacterium]|nr:23S rRNA (pseudouridine(1915)-N(3))-methyltransferase RlmH [Bacilli bacterium]HHU24558.1 23S rRNA (pseudouridine(1915)-N(3))-methyltransferase RlmH [Acholeplasmataceae bacterium]